LRAAPPRLCHWRHRYHGRRSRVASAASEAGAVCLPGPLPGPLRDCMGCRAALVASLTARRHLETQETSLSGTHHPPQSSRTVACVACTTLGGLQCWLGCWLPDVFSWPQRRPLGSAQRVASPGGVVRRGRCVCLEAGVVAHRWADGL